AAQRDITLVSDAAGLIYVVGGRLDNVTPVKDARLYNDHTHGWTDLPQIPNYMFNYGGALGPDGKMYLMGGADVAGDSTDLVQAFNPSTGAWEQAPHLPVSVTDPAAAASGGKVYVIGGAHTTAGIDTSTDTLVCFQPSLLQGSSDGFTATEG